MSVCAQTAEQLLQIAADLDGVTPDVMTLIDAVLRRVAQQAEDTRARFSTHHALWQADRHDIERLQDAENRQDAALTEIESAVAELNPLFDRLTQLERAVEEMRRLVARANLRDRA